MHDVEQADDMKTPRRILVNRNAQVELQAPAITSDFPTIPSDLARSHSDNAGPGISRADPSSDAPRACLSCDNFRPVTAAAGWCSRHRVASAHAETCRKYSGPDRATRMRRRDPMPISTPDVPPSTSYLDGDDILAMVTRFRRIADAARLDHARRRLVGRCADCHYSRPIGGGVLSCGNDFTVHDQVAPDFRCNAFTLPEDMPENS